MAMFNSYVSVPEGTAGTVASCLQILRSTRIYHWSTRYELLSPEESEAKTAIWDEVGGSCLSRLERACPGLHMLSIRKHQQVVLSSKVGCNMWSDVNFLSPSVPLCPPPNLNDMAWSPLAPVPGLFRRWCFWRTHLETNCSACVQREHKECHDLKVLQQHVQRKSSKLQFSEKKVWNQPTNIISTVSSEPKKATGPSNNTSVAADGDHASAPALWDRCGAAGVPLWLALFLARTVLPQGHLDARLGPGIPLGKWRIAAVMYGIPVSIIYIYIKLYIYMILYVDICGIIWAKHGQAIHMDFRPLQNVGCTFYHGISPILGPTIWADNWINVGKEVLDGHPVSWIHCCPNNWGKQLVVACFFFFMTHPPSNENFERFEPAGNHTFFCHWAATGIFSYVDCCQKYPETPRSSVGWLVLQKEPPSHAKGPEVAWGPTGMIPASHN